MTEHPAPASSSPLGSLPTEVIQELAAIGAAVGSNCEPCLTFHHDKARRMGFTNEQLTVAVSMAERVKNAPAGKIRTLAAQLLDVDAESLSPHSRG